MTFKSFIECALDGCGVTFKPRGSGQSAKKYCSERCRLKINSAKYQVSNEFNSPKAKVARAEAQRKYQKRHPEKIKKAKKNYRDSCAGKLTTKLYTSRPEGKEAQERYNNMPNAIARRKRYEKSPEGKAASKRYESSSLGLAASRRSTHKRRALQLDAFVEVVELQILIQQQNNLCSLCGTAFEGTHPNLLSPTVEHTQPLSKGGQHSYTNTTAAHRICNIKKGAKYVSS